MTTLYTAAEKAARNVLVAPTLKSVYALGATGAALTVTVPAAGAGQYHYFKGIQIKRHATSAVAGSALLTITTTNLTNQCCAAGTITMGGVAVADETFVIGTQTFTWKASRAAAGQVTIGANAAAAVTNLVTAINTDIPTVVFAEDGAGDTVVVTAVAGGSAGTAIVFTENATNMTMDGSGTLGGTTEATDTLSWTTANLIAAGATVTDVDLYFPDGALKSAAANTRTQFILPAPGTACFWSVNLVYFEAP